MPEELDTSSNSPLPVAWYRPLELQLVMGLEDVDVAIEIIVAGSCSHSGHILSVATYSQPALQCLFSEGTVVVVHE